MRRAAAQLRKAPRTQVSAVHSFPSPVGGLNERDSLAAMKPIDAIALENWFPRTTYVEARGGYSSHATGMTNNGKTLMVYNAVTGSNKMFCSTASGIYDVTSAGAVGASGLSRTNGKHNWFNFGDGTNNYLMAFNGVDAPAFYDGSSWTAITGATSPAITGVTTTSLVSGFVFKGRVILLENSSLSFWYLPAGAAGGAATEFPLDAEAPAGGFLMAGASWTVDGGDGIDDFCVFVTSEGELLVYRGTNPSSAAAWAKVGTYSIGKPLGRRCITRYGGDLLIVTQNGLFPLRAAMIEEAERGKLAVSYKIEKGFNDAARLYGDNFGWKATLLPRESALLVNVPVSEDGEHFQYVMNTITKAWTKFLEWDAEDFGVLNEELYFTRGTAVYKAWSGTSDAGSDIILYAKTAFNYFGTTTQQKHFKMFRPVLSVNGSIEFLTDIDVDFKDTPITGTATYSVTTGAQWDVSNWDDAYWAGGMQIVKQWTSPDEWEGYCAAGKLKITNSDLVIQWLSVDYVWQSGGVL